MTDVFAELDGQALAVRRLRAALESPVPAYLFQGPSGSGKRLAAALFAGELFARSCDQTDDERDRHRRLARQEHHPDLVIVERTGPSITAEQARHVVRSAALSPVDAALKLILLVDFHLVGDHAAVVLKAIEEPPPTTMFVVLAVDVPPELVTIASRCVRIDFVPLSHPGLVRRLVSEGVDPERAEVASDSSGGDLNRARLLATDPMIGERMNAWSQAPRRLDGSGHAVGLVVEEMLAMVDDAAGPLRDRHMQELAELEERVKRLGERGSGRRDLDTRHKRELRRHRTDELVFGLRAMAGTYRDSFDGSGGLGADEMVKACELLRAGAETLVRNPTERLALQSILVQLPQLG